MLDDAYYVLWMNDENKKMNTRNFYKKYKI